METHFSKEDEIYMKRAIELAKKGLGWVNPNPLVGAVIVKDGRIIGEGWHRKYGELHAERDALLRCGESTEGATMYVTLEPCTMCASAIIQSRISRVVFGLQEYETGGFGGKIDLTKSFNTLLVVEQFSPNDDIKNLMQKFFKNRRNI